jgi:hypothetical protein
MPATSLCSDCPVSVLFVFVSVLFCVQLDQKNEMLLKVGDTNLSRTAHTFMFPLSAVGVFFQSVRDLRSQVEKESKLMGQVQQHQRIQDALTAEIARLQG